AHARHEVREHELRGADEAEVDLIVLADLRAVDVDLDEDRARLQHVAPAVGRGLAEAAADREQHVRALLDVVRGRAVTAIPVYTQRERAPLWKETLGLRRRTN